MFSVYLTVHYHTIYLFTLGDLSYADCNPQRWDSYGVLVEPLSRERPWMVSKMCDIHVLISLIVQEVYYK